MPENNKLITDDDKAVEARRFQEQCFLIHHFGAFADTNLQTSYDNFVPISGNPTDVVNRMLAIPGLDGLMSIPPYLLSSLVPQVRLYKVLFPQENAKGQDVELPFQDFISEEDIRSITASGHGRGMGVGLKSFEWELLGTNPAESDNNIKAKLKLQFATMEDLAAPRANEGTDKQVSFLDLVSPSAKFNKPTVEKDGAICYVEGSRSYNNKYFRIRAHVGWASPKGDIWESGPGSKLKQIIEKSRTSLYLTLLTHTLEFGEDGSMSLELEYCAAMEGSLQHPNADVLLIGKTEMMTVRADRRAMERDAMEAAVSDEKDRNCRAGLTGTGRNWGPNEELDAQNHQESREEELKDEEIKDKALLYNSILSALEAKGGVYFVDVDPVQVGALSEGQAEADAAAASRSMAASPFNADYITKNRGTSTNTTAPLQEAAGATTTHRRIRSDYTRDEKLADAREEITTKALDSGKYRINYFHFGDLLDVALRCLYETNTPDLAELKVLTGPYSYTDPLTGTSTSKYNLCDIPISMNLFQVWFMDHVIKPQREKYPLKLFIKDTITKLVNAAMTPKCFGKEYGKALARVSTGVLEVPTNDNGTCRVTGTGDGKIGGKRINNYQQIKPFPTGENKDGKQAFSYLFLHVSSQSPKDLGPPASGTREERDADKGIYHFRIGSESGLVKKISFKKTDQPGAREARMEQEGELSSNYLREKYDADVEMFGNAVFKPGTMLYIDPTTVGAGSPQAARSIASSMGLGGYFVITEVKNAIEAGKFQTDLKCVWMASGSGLVESDKCGEGAEERCQEGQEGQTPGGEVPAEVPVSANPG